mgnify:CR=1 FL=1
MSKINHKQKVRLARQMLTPVELKARVPIFQTKGWFRRSMARLLKNNKKEIEQFIKDVNAVNSKKFESLINLIISSDLVKDGNSTNLKSDDNLNGIFSFKHLFKFNLNSGLRKFNWISLANEQYLLILLFSLLYNLFNVDCI